MQPPTYPEPIRWPKAPPFTMQRYYGVDHAGQIEDMGPDTEPRDYTGPYIYGATERTEMEVDQEAEEAPRECTLPGCSRVVPFRGYTSCCRTCWQTDGRHHGPICEERFRAAQAAAAQQGR